LHFAGQRPEFRRIPWRLDAADPASSIQPKPASPCRPTTVAGDAADAPSAAPPQSLAKTSAHVQHRSIPAIEFATSCIGVVTLVTLALAFVLLALLMLTGAFFAGTA
jgi:hypothetical protein